MRFVFTLLAASLLKTISCAADAPPAPHAVRVFRAGAAASNVTPNLGISLEGVIARGSPARHVHDELYARCLVLDDGATRVAIVVVDSTMIAREIIETAKQFAQTEIGFPANRILVAATHSHSTPRAVPISAAQRDLAYESFLARRIADGIRRAVENLAPAKIGWGAGSKPEFVFNRRSLIKPEARLPNPFGERTDQVQMGAPPGSPGIIGPADVVDPEVFVVSVQHADGRPLAVLANYGLHYIGGTGNAVVSADYFGAFADRLQVLLRADRQDPPFVGIMSNGTSGDVNNVDSSKPPRTPLPPYARIKQVADGIAAEAFRVYQGIVHTSWAPVAMEESELVLAVRRPTPARLEWARQAWAATPDKERLANRREVYARETLEVAKYPDQVPVKLQAIRIGALGLAATSCEMFASTGRQIKARSSLPQTFTITLANGYSGYLPTPRQHELGGYETWLARSSFLEVQASEKIRDELLRLLGRVAAAEPRVGARNAKE